MNLSPRNIDLCHFVQNSHVDSIRLPKFFRASDNEFLFRVDNPADVVGNASGGKGCVWAPLEDDDVQVGPTTFRLRGGAHPRGISADYNQSFFCHKCSSCQNNELRFAPYVDP